MAGKSNRSGDLDEQGRFRAITPEIVQLASVIQLAFVEFRENFMPNSTGVGKSKKHIFTKAAFHCQKLGIDPSAFVYQRIEAALERRAALYPEILISDAIGKLAQVTAVDNDDRIFNRLTFEFSEYERRRRVGFSDASILADRMINLTPLFRYCLATRYGLQRIADQYREAARVELRMAPVMRRIFAAEIATL